MQNEPNITNRRSLLKGALGAGVVAGVNPLLKAAEGLSSKAVEDSSGKSISLAQSDLIRTENAKPGTKDWMLANTRVDPKTKYRCPWIEGYCSHTSIRAGERLKVMVSTNPASPFVIDFYRLGYYNGDGGRH